jgi:group I intron endonuclease
MTRIIESAGVHVVIDAFVKDARVFAKEHLHKLFVDLVSALDMEVLVGPDFIEVPVDPQVLADAEKTGSFADDGGITGVCVISKSHIAIHCWPLRSFFSMDVFSCGDFDPEVALGLIRTSMGVERESAHVLNRKRPSVQEPCVYRITNKVNGKCYIGKSVDPSCRWGEHVWVSKHPGHKKFSAIHAALAKYGVDSFTFEVVQACASEQEAFEQETYWIRAHHANDRKHGYNLNEGGLGGKNPSLEVRRKRAEKMKGRFSGEHSSMYGKRGPAHPCFGTHRSEEFKRALSEARKGAGNPMFGKPLTREIRLAKSEQWKGEGNPNQPRFSVEDVERIKMLLAQGLTQREVAKQHGVSSSVVSRIRHNKYKPKTA